MEVIEDILRLVKKGENQNQHADESFFTRTPMQLQLPISQNRSVGLGPFSVA